MTSISDWQELRFATCKDRVEQLEIWLFKEGALSVTLEDAANQPLLEPGLGETPLWEVVTVTALFDGMRDLQPLIAATPEALVMEIPVKPIIVADQDWSRSWEKHFCPQQLGDRLWICPSWASPPRPEAINIMLDPGMAFGTGSHPTTAMCLRELDHIIEQGMRIVDYGCGSGILGIAALKLGAASVLAVDNDPQALVASQNNARNNNIEGQHFQAVISENTAPACWQNSADIVVSNILASPLALLAPRLANLLAPRGTLILSGLLCDQVAMVTDAYDSWIALEVVGQEAGWALLSGCRA